MTEMKFEEALKRLEKIVEELESGKLSLEDSLKRYEEGVKLSRFCHKSLQAAQKKIQVLTKKDEGWEVEPFTDNAEEQ
ncbi:MAG: exodeoxyribonuclease VII small subunit [Candidatus Omnitrophota bacterium]|nr:MAG: exodeoxyribonuclease VII small subunit [Candidatus Omnitrophota bacterium]